MSPQRHSPESFTRAIDQEILGPQRFPVATSAIARLERAGYRAAHYPVSTFRGNQRSSTLKSNFTAPRARDCSNEKRRPAELSGVLSRHVKRNDEFVLKFRVTLLQTWRRPTLPRLKTKYHWRWGVSRPSSEWDRVQPPRHNHQVGGSVRRKIWSFRACSYAHLSSPLSRR
jgi:hypothetical protein